MVVCKESTDAGWLIWNTLNKPIASSVVYFAGRNHDHS